MDKFTPSVVAFLGLAVLMGGSGLFLLARVAYHYYSRARYMVTPAQWEELMELRRAKRAGVVPPVITTRTAWGHWDRMEARSARESRDAWKKRALRSEGELRRADAARNDMVDVHADRDAWRGRAEKALRDLSWANVAIEHANETREEMQSELATAQADNAALRDLYRGSLEEVSQLRSELAQKIPTDPPVAPAPTQRDSNGFAVLGEGWNWNWV